MNNKGIEVIFYLTKRKHPSPTPPQHKQKSALFIRTKPEIPTFNYFATLPYLKESKRITIDMVEKETGSTNDTVS